MVKKSHKLQWFYEQVRTTILHKRISWTVWCGKDCLDFVDLLFQGECCDTSRSTRCRNRPFARCSYPWIVLSGGSKEFLGAPLFVILNEVGEYLNPKTDMPNHTKAVAEVSRGPTLTGPRDIPQCARLWVVHGIVRIQILNVLQVECCSVWRRGCTLPKVRFIPSIWSLHCNDTNSWQCREGCHVFCSVLSMRRKLFQCSLFQCTLFNVQLFQFLVEINVDDSKLPCFSFSF